MNEIWARLGILPEEQPGPELRRNFYRQLEASRLDLATADRLTWPQRWRRFLPDWRPASPALRLATALLIVVTGFGIARLRGRTVRERANALIGVAHPDFRAGLRKQAEKLGYL